MSGSSAVELNGEALDGLVATYISAAADQGASAGAPEEQLRHLLLAGDFAAASARLNDMSPALASSPWLEFQLKKHQFLAAVAAARSSGMQPAQLQAALDLARRELGPLALHAYCEAYTDFKRCMLALVSDSSSCSGTCSGGGGAAEASAELQEFAGMVARAVRQEAGASATAPLQLPLLLRYLLLLHRHQAHTGFHPHWWPQTSPATESLCARLLLPRRDALPPPALLDSLGDSLAASGVREHDVQALRTSLGCDREEAVTLLRRARGSASRALLDALAATHLDEGLLLELADEYAACRGLDPLPAASTSTEQHGGQVSDSPGSTGSGRAERQSPKRQRRPAKLGGGGGSGGGEEGGGGAALQLPTELSEQQLRGLVRQLEGLLSGGQAEAALQQLEAADPAFLPDHPAATFALNRCHFLDLLLLPAAAGGGATAALALARQQLSPLAQQHPELQPQLKATLGMLLPLSSGGDDAAAQKQRQHCVADAVSALRTALRPRCHAREPRLLGLLRELLSLHQAHFKLQRCQDRFAADLGIPALKAAPAPASAAAHASPLAAQPAAAAAQPHPAAAVLGLGLGLGRGEVPVPGVRELLVDLEDMEEESDEEELEEESSDGTEDTGVSEQAIVTVCEFTGLPRHTAIELLLVHGGDPAAVLAHMFP